MKLAIFNLDITLLQLIFCLFFFFKIVGGALSLSLSSPLICLSVFISLSLSLCLSIISVWTLPRYLWISRVHYVMMTTCCKWKFPSSRSWLSSTVWYDVTKRANPVKQTNLYSNCVLILFFYQRISRWFPVVSYTPGLYFVTDIDKGIGFNSFHINWS